MNQVFFKMTSINICGINAGKNAAPCPKGEGQSLMVSDFLTADWGRLCDEDRCVLLYSFSYFLSFS
jgi:hypothetical protein